MMRSIKNKLFGADETPPTVEPPEAPATDAETSENPTFTRKPPTKPRLPVSCRGNRGVRKTALTQARSACGWTQQALWLASDVHPNQIYRIEIGQVPASPDEQTKLSRALVSPIEDLFDLEGYVLCAVKPKKPIPKTHKIWVCGRGWPKVTLARLTAGLTTQQLADAVGWEQRKVQKLERLAASASPSERKVIAKALGVRVGDIFQENGFTAFVPKYEPGYGRVSHIPGRLLPIPHTRLSKLRLSKKKAHRGSLRAHLARAAELPGGPSQYLEIERREVTANVEVCEAIARELGVPVEELFSPLGLALLP